MNAMAVPPTGSYPFHDPRSPSRRNFEQGLALSALVHLSALGLILWAQAQTQTEEVRLTQTPIDVIRFPADPPPRILPPLVPSPPTTATTGEIVVKDIVPERPVISRPDVTPGVASFPGQTTGSSGDPGRTDGNHGVSAAIDPDPPEGVFVPYDEPPVPLSHPDPVYPDWARENGIEGRVILHALVGTDGRVRRVTVIRGIQGLSESASDALRRWTFTPARASHQAIAVWIEVPFVFRL